MNPTVKEIITRARTLPPLDRQDIIEDLIDSLDPAGAPDDESAILEKIAERVRELDEGRATTVSSEEVHREARMKYGIQY